MRMSERIWDPPETMLTRWLQCSQCTDKDSKVSTH
jgi:hypothetical protein